MTDEADGYCPYVKPRKVDKENKNFVLRECTGAYIARVIQCVWISQSLWILGKSRRAGRPSR